MRKLWTCAGTGLLAGGLLAGTASADTAQPARTDAIILRGSASTEAMEPVRTDALAELDAVIENGIEQEVFPGAVLVVGKPGEILWAQPYGHKTYDEDADPVTLDSLFDMASVSKVAATASMAWRLLGEGVIALDDPVSDYIPNFDSGGKDGVTVKDLLTHVSGLKSYENRNVVEQQRREDETPAQALIRHYAELEASYEPRTDYVYSCLNFQTLARVNEIAAGRQMEGYLHEHIFGPLGMNDSVFNLSEDQKNRTMPTLRLDDGSLLVAEIHDPLANYHGVGEHCPGNAGLFSTGPDMARFCEMVLNEGRATDGTQLIDPEIIRLSATDQTPEAVSNRRGLGWVMYSSFPWATEKNQEDGHRVIGHTGYTGTLIWIDQHSQTYFTLLTNRVYPDDSRPDGITIAGVRRQVAEAVLRAQPEYADIFAERDAEEAAEAEEPAGK